MIIIIISIIVAIIIAALGLKWFIEHEYNVGVADFNRDFGTHIDPKDLPGPWRDPS